MLVAVAVWTFAGCQYPLPAGFVKVEPPYGLRFKAVSAEGEAVTLRVEPNPENGDLAFWEKAVSGRLVAYRGYKLVQRREVRLSSGTPGLEMAFDYQRDGIDYLYLVTLVVKGHSVYCIEAAGEKSRLSPQLPAIQNVIARWPLP
jgi:hypothetical protein